MNNISSSQITHEDPSFGNANIDQQKVYFAIDALIQFLSPSYMAMINEAFEKVKNNSLPDKENNLFIKKIFEDTNMSVPLDSLNEAKLGEQRFYVSMFRKISELDENNPFENLLILLSQRITELEPSFISKRVEIRFEKGFLHGLVNEWHYDGHIFGTTTTVGYSNKNEWSTRVVNEIDVRKIFGNDKPSNSTLNKEKDKLEPFSQASLHGFFYHPIDIVHRSPIKEDLSEEIKADDYRLFLRFSKGFLCD